MKTKFHICCFLLLAATFSRTSAQKPVPRDSIKMVYNGKAVVINYGKPSMSGRKIFGSFVPYYKIWRTGAGVATTLKTEADLEMDGAVVPRGTYSLYTLPAEDRCKLIINKQVGQWGIVYTPQLDLARVDLIIKKLKLPVEDLTFKLEKNNNGGGALKIEWEKSSFSVPFQVSTEPLVPSPRDSISLAMGGNRIVIDYGRPSMRGRKIMGGVVPYGVVWRTGANAATGFVTQTDLTASGVIIPRGAYTLYTLPSSKQWKLIINKQTGQWGTIYNQKLDLVRIPLKKKTLKQSVEKFTITIEQVSETDGVIKFAWEKTELSTAFKIK